MLFLKGFREYLFTIVVMRCFSATYGIAVYDNKVLRDEEKRGVTEEKRGATEVKNEVRPTGKDLDKAKTEKRGIWEIGSHDFRDGPPRPYGPPLHGGYEPIDYGGGGRYPHTGLGSYGHSGYEPGDYKGGGRYPHTGLGSYGHSVINMITSPGYYEGGHHHGYPEENYRPSGYGPSHRPNYGPPYEEGYEHEEPHYQGYVGSAEGYGMGNFKGLALKKLLLPLAGIAILGVAAAAAKNPVLLKLGVLNGRGKRSALPLDVYPSNPKVRPREEYKNS